MACYPQNRLPDWSDPLDPRRCSGREVYVPFPAASCRFNDLRSIFQEKTQRCSVGQGCWEHGPDSLVPLRVATNLHFGKPGEEKVLFAEHGRVTCNKGRLA